MNSEARHKRHKNVKQPLKSVQTEPLVGARDELRRSSFAFEREQQRFSDASFHQFNNRIAPWILHEHIHIHTSEHLFELNYKYVFGICLRPRSRSLHLSFTHTRSPLVERVAFIWKFILHFIVCVWVTRTWDLTIEIDKVLDVLAVAVAFKTEFMSRMNIVFPHIPIFEMSMSSFDNFNPIRFRFSII